MIPKIGELATLTRSVTVFTEPETPAKIAKYHQDRVKKKVSLGEILTTTRLKRGDTLLVLKRNDTLEYPVF